jgi:hypothetical protein
MSAGKSRQRHCRCLNAAAISAVVRAGVPYVWGRSLGAHLFLGAVPGCRSMYRPGGGEAQGAWAR